METAYSIAASYGIAWQLGNSEDAKLSKPIATTSREPMDLHLAQVPEGRVHVIAERCKQCDFCITYCPTEVLVYSNDVNAKGYHYPLVADGKESACICCKYCDLICPELAIFTTDAADEESGEDGFNAG